MILKRTFRVRLGELVHVLLIVFDSRHVKCNFRRGLVTRSRVVFARILLPKSAKDEETGSTLALSTPRNHFSDFDPRLAMHFHAFAKELIFIVIPFAAPA